MKKHGWLLYRRADAESNKSYIEWMKEEAVRIGWTLDLVYRDEVIVGVKRGQLQLRYVRRQGVDEQTDRKEAGRFYGQTDPNFSRYPDFVIVRTVDPVLTTQLEHLHIPVFNSAAVSRICNNKALTYQYLQQLDIPMLDTEFCNTAELQDFFRSDSVFQHKHQVAKGSDGSAVSDSGRTSDFWPDSQTWGTFRSLGVPFVIKTVAGRGGEDVALIERPNQLEAFIRQHPATDVVLQELGPHPGKDIRVFVVGDEIVAAVLRLSTSADFRANFSLGGTAERYHLNDAETTIVRRIVSHFDFGMVGIDFLPDGAGGLLFNEIEDVVGSRTLSRVAPDVNIVRRYLKYIEKRLS